MIITSQLRYIMSVHLRMCAQPRNFLPSPPSKAVFAKSLNGATMVRRVILQLIASSVFSAPPIELRARTIKVVEVYDDNSV